MVKRCCGKLNKLNIDYSGIVQIPYFAKRKDRDAWIRNQKAQAKAAQVAEVLEEETDQSEKIDEPTQVFPQIYQAIEVQLECRADESPREES